MNCNFDDLADNARIWIFQSKSELAEGQEKIMDQILTEFTSNWQAHGNDLMASHTIYHKRFLIVALDEASYQATGCSIDKLTHLVLKMERDLDLNLLDRMQIAYVENDEVLSMPMSKFKAAIGDSFDKSTMVFNNMIETKADLFDKWNVELQKSWHKQMLA